jgi:hypothetical protein
MMVVLLGSPLLGPAVWRPAAEVLSRLGFAVLVPDAAADPPRSPSDVLEHLLAELPAAGDVALVAHSNAGLYVPALAERRRVVASVFADAALPPASGSAPMAPPAMLPMLTGMADDAGVLPPWTDWWPQQQVAALFPDAATRAAVSSEQHRLPLGYFTATLAVPEGWTARPAAYLRFSEAYQAQAAEAAALGWPVSTLEGNHLHPLWAPDAVADAVATLLGTLRGPLAAGE